MSRYFPAGYKFISIKFQSSMTQRLVNISAFRTQVARKVDGQWDKIMDGVENQPSSSSSSRQGRKTPLASNTRSLNVKNKSSDSKELATASTASVTASLASKTAEKKLSADAKPSNDHSASSSERAKPTGAVHRARNVHHTAPVVASHMTDDTDNDITTDSDMAQTEDDKIVVSSSVFKGLIAQLANKQTDSRQARHSRGRPASARERRQTSRERDSQRSASGTRRRLRDRQEADASSAVPLLEQDRQEPDGRSSRQGRLEEKLDLKATTRKKSAESPSRAVPESSPRRGQSLERGNNTGSSEPPTVIEVRCRNVSIRV